MVGLRDNRFARMERLFPLCGSGHSQVADTDIAADDVGMRVLRGIGDLQFQAHQQVELFLGFVIPQLRCPDLDSLRNLGNVLVVSRVGNHHTAIQGQDREMGVFFEAVVLLVLIGQGGRDVLGWLIQPLVALLGLPSFAGCRVLFHFGPERLIGRTDLAGNATGHLGRQMETCTDIIIGAVLQEHAIAALPMRVRILTDKVQGIAIGQLRGTQCLELLGRGMQFEFGRYHLFHTFYGIIYSTACQDSKMVEYFLACGRGQFLPPTSTEAGILARFR